jgi:predicted transposase/invertase (TIGR01784 family)
MDHDGSYKQIFSNPETIKELLQDFVHEGWTQEIDYNSLEKYNASYIADSLQSREDDIIWRVKHKNNWLYIYLLLEFQSRNDIWMALRIMVYTGLLYQDLIKSKAVTSKDKLPPVFPLVLYNGKNRWTAARNVADLIEPYPGVLQRYRPNQKYFLLDEGRIKERELEGLNSTVSEIIRLENSPTPEELKQIVSRLTLRLHDKRHDSLRRALVVWINRIVLKRMIPEENIPNVTELQEIDNMLAERVEEWTEKWKQQGIKQGMQQGIQQGKQQGIQQGMQQGIQRGKQQGKSALLLRLVKKRFGKIPIWAEEKISTATKTELDEWSDNIFIATTIEELFQ